MTTDQAIKILNGAIKKPNTIDGYLGQALTMAIEALNCSEIPNNSDLISRQAAIDALDEQITQCDKALGSFDISMKDEYAVKVERASLMAFRETLEYMPSAQPDVPDTNVGELISRQDAIDLVKSFYKIDKSVLKIMVFKLKQLPFVQPETNCSEIPNNSDLISRQAAIDAADNMVEPQESEG